MQHHVVSPNQGFCPKRRCVLVNAWSRRLPALTIFSSFFCFLRAAGWFVSHRSLFMCGCGAEKGGGEQDTECGSERRVFGRGGVDRHLCGRRCRLGEIIIRRKIAGLKHVCNNRYISPNLELFSNRLECCLPRVLVRRLLMTPLVTCI